ncbi:MAG: EF-hand domain-containing protein, partial [Verrucomicrobiales bacterium]
MKTAFLTLAAVALTSAAAIADEGDKPKKEHNPLKQLAKADTDKDGKVSEAEFVEFAKNRKKPLDEEKAKKQFAKMDKNSDGFVTGDEIPEPKKKDGG